MLSQRLSLILCLLLSAVSVFAQSLTASSDDGYTGYSLELTGDPDSAVYETLDTVANVSTTVPPPDVFLNASVYVGEIDLVVQNLTAKVNLDAQVLSLLQFNAGVDLSIASVNLLIQNVSAEVTLEARLANLVTMIDDVLNSIDLNPVLATLGQDLGEIVNSTTGLLGDGVSVIDSVAKRSLDFDLANNILYSVNNYVANKHTNRILEQNGDIVDETLNNDGVVSGTRVIGSYATDMTYNGINATVEYDGETVQELQYTYAPLHGIMVVSAIFVNDDGNVVGTQVLSELSAGGSSSIGGDL